MAISSLLRSRRFSNQRAGKTQQLITFQLQQEWFALPIQAVQRVIPLGKVYGDPSRKGVSLTAYQDQELLVVDVAQRIFGGPRTLLASPSEGEAPEQRYLIIIQTFEGRVGLPIDRQPVLRRVPEASFGPLPPGYVSEGNIQCVSSVSIHTADLPPMFLLDPDQLMRPQNLIAPAR